MIVVRMHDIGIRTADSEGHLWSDIERVIRTKGPESVDRNTIFGTPRGYIRSGVRTEHSHVVAAVDESRCKLSNVCFYTSGVWRVAVRDEQNFHSN